MKAATQTVTKELQIYSIKQPISEKSNPTKKEQNVCFKPAEIFKCFQRIKGLRQTKPVLCEIFKRNELKSSVSDQKRRLSRKRT